MEDKIQVAPLAGAWIEIDWERRYVRCARSLLSQERGLKYYADDNIIEWIASLLSQERGLKFNSYVLPRDMEMSLLSQERGLK